MNQLLEPSHNPLKASLIEAFCFISLVLYSTLAFSIQPIEFEFQVTRDTKRVYDGIDGLDFERLETQFRSPIFKRKNTQGVWLGGFDASENRMFLSGVETGARRFYRFALPIQYFAKRNGRTQHEWMLTPAYYSDESLIDQKRISLEYAWQLRYFKNRKMSFVAGLSSDSRFGVNGMYPIFGLEAKPNKHIFHHWVFPNIYTQIQLQKRLTAKAFVQINGGNWDYLLSSGAGASNFGITDWKVGLGARLKTRMPFDLVAEVGLRIMGSAAINGTAGDLDSSYFVTLGIKTPFELGSSPYSRDRN
jgi:hypothetical protein